MHFDANSPFDVRRLDLKPLTHDLLPAAVDLDQRCFGGLWTIDGYQREIDSPNSELLALMGEWGAEENAKSKPASLPTPNLLGLGCYWAILEEAHITILAIDPNYQRQGLGQVLLVTLLHSAHKRGLERATLEVRISNQSARSLYAKFGFQEVGYRRRYYPDTGEDALVLWRGDLQYPQFQRYLHTWQTAVDQRLATSNWRLLTDIADIAFGN
ncbi:ribosomal protein S18-alanine N-acetyltransferase [Leptolyngbya sp. FACHB-36]|uniref:ribosomal protein S18-alanine N-acetyltransferase n=1 Tax=Leptolyngbya sp. FACHB-36 TaxID=2692808 RepID=UPI0032200B12